MESRAPPAALRPGISRRSCDQCRSRKTGCDRGSPCSNCVSGRLECTHSAVAARSTPPKQRVLISAKYEQKIDQIARDVNDIKTTLQGTDSRTRDKVNKTLQLPEADIDGYPSHTPGDERVSKRSKVEPAQPKPVSSWDHSVQIIDFVKAVVEDGSRCASQDSLYYSLKRLVSSMEDAPTTDGLRRSTNLEPLGAIDMPPLDAVLALLRWVKAHQNFHRVMWLSQVLPISKFEDICRNVYFAVDGYDQIEYLLANGFLMYMFSEHGVSTAMQTSKDYSQACRDALAHALEKLPLILPPTLEVIAALVIATLHAIENSKSAHAWIYISSAMCHCQTLRLHRQEAVQSPSQKSGQDLFIAVYRFEKGLSLRLGRPSSIRDAEIAPSAVLGTHRATRSARIQGQVFDQLYSASAKTTAAERGMAAWGLAEETKDNLAQIRSEISQCISDGDGDPMRELYLRADMVCYTSLLALILRAVPSPDAGPRGPNECIAAAREVFELHQECMVLVRDSDDPPTVRRYLNWSVLHVPFAPFSILFTQAVQQRDMDDLARLERFVASLKPKNDGEASPTHPHRLYDLLYQTACLYIETGKHTPPASSTVEQVEPHNLDVLDGNSASEYINGMGEYDPMLGQLDTSFVDLGEWYQGNQQFLRFLDEGILF